MTSASETRCQRECGDVRVEGEGERARVLELGEDARELALGVRLWMGTYSPADIMMSVWDSEEEGMEIGEDMSMGCAGGLGCAGLGCAVDWYCGSWSESSGGLYGVLRWPDVARRGHWKPEVVRRASEIGANSGSFCV